MKPLVSVIVPVYKVEDYLVRCLDSLRRQSLSNIEILLIDDASPDRCSEICDTFVAKDPRFRVFHNESNQGLSAVRNFGIAKASSNYLMFVDSDDWVHEDFCKEAYESAVKYHADLVMFGCHRIKKSGYVDEAVCQTSGLSESGYKTQMEAIDALQKNGIWQAPWNKLYRKELFDGISFPSGCLYEGTGTVYKAILKASSIYFLNIVLYYYCYRAGSITAVKTEKSLHDWIEMSIQQYNDLAAWGYPIDKLDTFLQKRALSYCIMKKPDDSDRHYTFCANTLLGNKSIPAEFSWKQKVLFVLFKYCRLLFEWICILYDKKVC